MEIRSDETLILDLRELIAALDRRVRGIERKRDLTNARDAQALRRAALKRICELGRLRCGQATCTVAQEAV